MAEVLSRERRLRDRNTQLLIPGKSFKRVLDFLQHAQVGATARLPFACSRAGLNLELTCRSELSRCKADVQGTPNALNNQNLPLARAWR